MTLSIGQLMKGLLGDVQPVDSKALELKVGQIVRGVLMKMLSDQEAVIQINGMQVQAKLEAPLQPGQSTLLQVQPHSLDGTLVLKMVDQQAAALPEASVKDWLKAAGLPEQKWSAELVRDLRRDGGALTRETASQFKQAFAAMPAGSDARSWSGAAALAFKRGLPMTSATIGALAQTLSGAPAHELLAALERGLAAWSGASAGDAADESAQPRTAGQAAAAKLQTLLAEGAALMRAAQGGAEAQPPAFAAGARGAAAEPASAGAAGIAAAPADAPRSAAAGTAAPGAGGAAAAGAQPAARAASQPQAPAAAIAPAGTAAPAPEAAATSGASAQGAGTAAQGQGPQAAANSSSNWVGQMMKWLGVDHERLLAASAANEQLKAGKLLETPRQSPTEAEARTLHGKGRQQTDQSMEMAKGTAMDSAIETILRDRMQIQPGSASLPAAPIEDNAADPAKHAADTLKSALMTLASAEDVPKPLRDAAQQLVSHITGQQLLLTPERTSSLFSHVTMFIPLQGENGSQTASVHIQTRRGRKGELDANNCRLLFDLRMNSLGETVVDVQVVDKIVNLNLWNDHPLSATIIESSRTELAEALRNAGYQLLSLKATPMPDRVIQRLNEAEAKAPGSSRTEWSTKPYKGVDYRA
ncbi:flagellar hook-length control protein FliK [Paenibacillus montanisoli]|uniref:Flagellar hook-length control protein-like C-terminal domain-containing protein n=1 Tax=Paenibacillus montanisoli TaxID=2081970 RepID=A0A328U0D3_9BACL|nr:flagellar hook-length control protein FliK [Paenibacillus montanisoli]RAP76277.1 hypothetical protein DL346_12805 [Paenibacillus montanisoli]